MLQTQINKIVCGHRTEIYAKEVYAYEVRQNFRSQERLAKSTFSLKRPEIIHY